ncbi:MAG: hypothetical protein ACKERG_04025 [Candidatus Hodgkinia cicadicola]
MCGLLVCLFVGLFGCVSALSASALAPSATLRPSVFSSFFLSLRRRGGGSCGLTTCQVGRETAAWNSFAVFVASEVLTSLAMLRSNSAFRLLNRQSELR